MLGVVANKLRESSQKVLDVVEYVVNNRELLLTLIILLAVLILIRVNLLRFVLSVYDKFILLFEKTEHNHLTSVYGMKVYSSAGDYIGVVKEIYLGKTQPAVYGWLIEVEGRVAKEMGHSLVLVKQSVVKSIGQVMILKIENFNLSKSDDAESLIEGV